MGFLKGLKDLFFQDPEPLPETFEGTGIWPATGNPREWIDKSHPSYTPSIYADRGIIDVTGSGIINPIARSAKGAVRTLRNVMASESKLRGKPLKSAVSSKVGDLIDSPVGKVRYDASDSFYQGGPMMHQYTIQEGPAKGMTFSTKTQNLEDIAKSALRIAGKEESIPEYGLKGLVDETTRGLWLHGRSKYPKTGETFADSRIRVGNLGEPYGLSLTADKELLKRSFAKDPTSAPDISDYTSKYAMYKTVKKSKQGMKHPQAQEIKNDLLDMISEVKEHDMSHIRDIDIPTPAELYTEISKKVGKGYYTTGGEDSQEMFVDYEILFDEWEDVQTMIDNSGDKPAYAKELAGIEAEITDMIKASGYDFKPFLHGGQLLTPGQFEKQIASYGGAPPFARVFPKFGGKPGEKVLPAWVAPETKWAQKIIGNTYIESLPGDIKEDLIKRIEDMKDLSEIHWEKYKDGTPSLIIKEAFEKDFVDDRDLVKEHFNKRISENLLKKGYKALLYSPQRYDEYEMRMLDPNDVMMLDMRKQEDPALERMYSQYSTPSPLSGKPIKLDTLTEAEFNDLADELLPQPGMGKGRQAKRIDKWKQEAAGREGASLGHIYEKITWEDIDRVLNKPSNPKEDLSALISEADELLKEPELSEEKILENLMKKEAKKLKIIWKGISK